MIVFHSSDYIVEKHVFHERKKSNDYGYGFYATESLELAKEWACAKNNKITIDKKDEEWSNEYLTL